MYIWEGGVPYVHRILKNSYLPPIRPSFRVNCKCGNGGVPYAHRGGGYPMYTFGQKSGTEPVPSSEGSQFQLHPSGSAGWTLSGEDLGKFGLEKANLGVFEAILRPF